MQCAGINGYIKMPRLLCRTPPFLASELVYVSSIIFKDLLLLSQDPYVTIIASSEHHASGMLDGDFVDLKNAHGVAIYYPARPSQQLYQIYQNDLTFAADAKMWPAFLQAQLSSLSVTPSPAVNPVAPLPFIPSSGSKIFLPVIIRP